MISGKQAAAIALTMIIAMPILMGFAFASESVTRTETVTDTTANVSEFLLNSETHYFTDYSGPSNNGPLVKYEYGTEAAFVQPGYTLGSASSIPYGAPSVYTLALTPGVYVSTAFTVGGIDIHDWAFYTDGTSEYDFEITHIDGSVETHTEIYPRAVIFTGTTLSFGNIGFDPWEYYEDVDSVAVKSPDLNSIDLNYYLPDLTRYADITAGWSVGGEYYWMNGHINQSATLYLKMLQPASGTYVATMQPSQGYTAPGIDPVAFTVDEDGVMTASSGSDSVTLGKYLNVQIVIDCLKKTITVAGIASWPAFNSAPETFNTATFDMNSWADDFELITLDDTAATGAAKWRVDNAAVAAGTSPVTENCVLDLPSIYPGREYSLKLNSIGLYGDSIRIAGQSYNVTDGKITVDGDTVNLKGMVIKATEDNGTWTTTINGGHAVDTAAQPTVGFYGIWSLTAAADLLKDVTVTTEEWVPGVFAFDKDDFILLMIITAAAVFVVLGFTAGRSGGKVALLALACGGASVIALMLV